MGLPIGPVGVLGVRRMLVDGRLAGLASGLGAASGDVLFGAMAGFGISAVSHWLAHYRQWFAIVAAVFLLFIGGKALLRGSEANSGDHVDSEGLLRDYAQAFGLTIVNPTTIIAYIGIFAEFGLAGGEQSYFRVGAMVLGVFFGSLSWWLILLAVASMFESSFTPRLMRRINLGSGGLLIVLGFGALGLFVYRQVA